MLSLSICCAISSNAIVPEPLSLMPGPSGTLSRWPPAITTLSGSPPGVSASRFSVVVGVMVVSVNMRILRPEVAASWLPSAKEIPIVGIPGRKSPRVPASVSVRPGWPSLKMIAPDGSRGSRVCCLEPEVTGAALHEGDVARREAREVRRLATAVRRARVRTRRKHEVHIGDVGRRVRRFPSSP